LFSTTWLDSDFATTSATRSSTSITPTPKDAPRSVTIRRRYSTVGHTDCALSNGLSDITFRQNILEASLLVPINKTFAARFYYRYDTAKIRDWHYDGVAENPVPANGTVFLDSGPQDYRANVFGVFLRVTL